MGERLEWYESRGLVVCTREGKAQFMIVGGHRFSILKHVFLDHCKTHSFNGIFRGYYSVLCSEILLPPPTSIIVKMNYFQ